MAVNMGRHGLLFVTLTGKPNAVPEQLPLLFSPPGPRWADREAAIQYIANATGIKDIPEDDIPKVVWFTDPSNPNSADCTHSENLRGTYDKVNTPHVTRATLQMVHEPPTTGIDRLLPWLPAVRNAPHDRFHPYTIGLRPGNAAEHCGLHTDDFQWGM